jgi:hypothetical protein
MLTKEQLIDAHEQGLSINTRNGNIKIVCILGDVYGVNHCDTNSKLVKWWMFENFERNQATIEQPKPKIDLSILKEGEIYYAKSTMYNYLFKFRYSTQSEIIWDSNVLLRDSEIYNLSGGIKLSYVTELRLLTESELELFYSKFPELKPKKYNGRAVKCDTVDQSNWLGSFELSQSDIDNNYVVKTDGGYCSKLFAIENNYEIISFSQYCTENGINEPKWIQGFEVGKDYNDVVMVSDDNVVWYIDILNSVSIDGHFNCTVGEWVYCRYPRKDEINEIKFID